MEDTLNKKGKVKKCTCPSCSKIGSAILFVLLVVSIFTNGFGVKSLFIKGGSSQEIIDNAMTFINDELLPPDSGATLEGVDFKEKIEVTKFQIKIADKTYDSFVSQNGEYLFPDVIKMAEALEAKDIQGSAQVPADIVKADEPNIDLFIMSYCPFGLQAQKTMLPVYDLLKDKANIKMRFVDYIMHDKQELDENLVQYCIQSESLEKYRDYLYCFVEDGDSEKCLLSANVDQGTLNSCVTGLDREYNISADYEDKDTWLNGTYPKFDVEKDLNELYNVGGSPTIIINGQAVNINPRTPENYKAFICQSFNIQPEECLETLSTDTPVPSFGTGVSSSSDDGSCD